MPDPPQAPQPNRSAAGAGQVPSSYQVDLDLVRQVLDRDPVAIDAFIARLAKVPAIVRAKNRRSGGMLTEDEERDTAQESMAAIWAKLATYGGRSKLDTWIYGFAATQVLRARQIKGRQRTKSNEDALQSQPASTPDNDLPMDPRKIHNALEKLDPAQAAVVRLRHFDELRFEEIAARLNIKLSSVKSRYYRSMPKLQQALSSFWEARP